MKKIIFGIITITILTYSCNKPKGDGECIWKYETTGMNLGICKMQSPTNYSLSDCSGLDSLDSCNYDVLLIGLGFDTKLLPHEVCSSTIDSIIGSIEDIIVICNNDYNNNFKENDTLNAIIDVIYNKRNGMPTKDLLSLENYLSTIPICASSIYMFLNQPPDSIALQSFKIIYKEIDGTTYTKTTKSIYITP